MKNNKNLVIKIAILITLISSAVIWRLINHNLGLLPNLELITTVTVLAAIIFGARAAIVAPIIAIIASDLVIGNSSIFIFTWSSFAVIGLGAILLRKLNKQPGKQILASAGFAIASSFLFFFVTNLGVWLQGWYPATLDGLMTCFTLAIPFYRTMLIGNLILVPLSVAGYQFIRTKIAAKDLVINASIS